MAKFLYNFIALSAFVALVQGHSWIACSDYAEKNAGVYDVNLCRGFSRNAEQYTPKNTAFGTDTGFDHHPGETNPCKTGRDDSSYLSGYPMAVYYPGQQVVLAHPMKNHGSESCTNMYIPDNGNWIYRGGKNEAGDRTLSGFRQTLVADLGKSIFGQQGYDYSSYPKPGYQNAPNFCSGTDKALATYSFNVPTDLEPGQYTFVWMWGFNSPQDLYSTCFEVEIVNTVAERNSLLVANGFSNFYEPCGGLTSDGQTAGSTNPGCTGSVGSTVATSTTTVGPPSSSTTTSTTTTSQATTASTASTTTPSYGNSLDVLVNQMAGEVLLSSASSGIQRRYISVHFDCPVIANFWNIRVIGQHDVQGTNGKHYDLVQEGNSEIDSAKFYYHATFTTACNLQAYPVVAELEYEEM